MVTEIRLEIERWHKLDNIELAKRVPKLLEIARSRSTELAQCRGSTDRIISLTRWAKLEALADLSWDIEQKIEGGERLAVWELDILHGEETKKRCRPAIEEVSEGW